MFVELRLQITICLHGFAKGNKVMLIQMKARNGCLRNLAEQISVIHNDFIEGHSASMFMLDLLQERWSSCSVSNESRIPSPRDKATGWSHANKLVVPRQAI